MHSKLFALTLTFLAITSRAVYGASWYEVNTGLPSSVPGVRSLAVDPQTPSTLYARTSTGGLFKSTDGGGLWKPLSGVAGVASFVIDPSSPSTIYAATSQGILKSTNGGESWVVTGQAKGCGGTLAIDPVTPSTLYAAPEISDHICKSTDGGENWRAFSLGLPTGAAAGPLVILIDPVTPSTAYAVALYTQVFKSTDGGESWNAIGEGSGVASRLRQGAIVAMHPRNHSIFYSATPGPSPSILQSTDGGESWNAIMNTSLPPLTSLAVDPTSPSILYAGTYTDGLFKTTEGGRTWNAVNSGLEIYEVRALAVNPIDPAILYEAGRGGVFKSTDAGAGWTRTGLSAYTGSLVVDPVNPNILYADVAMSEGSCYAGERPLLKSTDGGASWSDEISPPFSGCILHALIGGVWMAIDPGDPNVLYAATYGEDTPHLLFKTADGGSSWRGLDVCGYSYPAALAIDAHNPGTLYAATASGVCMSVDGGTTWKNAGLSDINVLAIDPVNPNIVYAATANGLFKSADGGASWIAINRLARPARARAAHGRRAEPTDITALVIDPHNPEIVYAGTSGHGVYKSSDGGLNWIPFNDGLTNFDIRILVLVRGATKALYAGTPGGVFKIVEDADQ